MRHPYETWFEIRETVGYTVSGAPRREKYHTDIDQMNADQAEDALEEARRLYPDKTFIIVECDNDY